jgi:hypothetical protein
VKFCQFFCSDSIACEDEDKTKLMGYNKIFPKNFIDIVTYDVMEEKSSRSIEIDKTIAYTNVELIGFLAENFSMLRY